MYKLHITKKVTEIAFELDSWLPFLPYIALCHLLLTESMIFLKFILLKHNWFIIC